MAFLLDVMDLRNILDLISSPCLLVNSETGKIETGNFLFSSLSGYSLDEIQNVALDSLLMGINLQSATDGGNSQSQLNRKLIEPLSVNLSFRFIGTTGNQILISLGDKGIRRNTDFEDILIQLVDVLREFPKIKRSEYIEQVINVLIQNKFSDDIAIFAIKDSKQTFLSRFAINNRTNLPLEIPALELERIVKLDIWQPGRRVLSEIHRTARDNKYSCMYSLPIFLKGIPQAILVLGYQSETYNEQRENSILQIGKLISIITSFLLNIEELYNEALLTSYSLDKYLAGFENSSEGFLVIDQSNNILDFNTRFTQIFYYTPVEIQNRDLVRLFGTSGASEISNFINNSSDQTKKGNLTLIDRKGNERFLEVTYISQIGDHTGQKMLIFRDNSESIHQRKLIERLEKQADLGETLAEFAHDARNIINRQATGIQLLAKKLQLPAEENKELLDLLEESDNLNEMMESVLSFSRQDPGEFQEIDLGNFIQGVIYRNKFKAEKMGVEVRFNNRFPEARILGYQRSLERVLLNLINNGIDAVHDQQGTVSVTLLSEESIPDLAVIRISDTGPGIPENITGVLLSKQFSDKATGTGLGLLISHKIIEAHHGQMLIDSFSGGTIFSILLPLHDQGEEN